MLLSDQGHGKETKEGFWGVAKDKRGWDHLVRRARARIGQGNLGMPETKEDPITVWEDISTLRKKEKILQTCMRIGENVRSRITSLISKVK